MSDDGMAEHSVEPMTDEPIAIIEEWMGKVCPTLTTKPSDTLTSMCVIAAENLIREVRRLRAETAPKAVGLKKHMKTPHTSPNTPRRDELKNGYDRLDLRLTNAIANWREWGHGIENRVAVMERAGGATEKEPIVRASMNADEAMELERTEPCGDCGLICRFHVKHNGEAVCFGKE